MVAPLVIALIAAVVAVGLSLLLMPRIKREQDDSTKDLENPVAEAGKPLPVPFGTIQVKGLNILWYGDKSSESYEAKSSEGGGAKK